MKSLQIIGPYFTNYSLAKTNRGLAMALSHVQSEYEVSLWCPDDRIDWKPTEKELAAWPELDSLVSREQKHTDIVIFNNTARHSDGLLGLADLPGDIIIPNIAWEETVFPAHIVAELNTYAHAIIATSTFTKQILQRNGVKIPIFTVLNGLDPYFINKPSEHFEIKTTKAFKFLHISTGRARKGTDVLLKAYFGAFTKDDDVTLVIKSFPNPDNRIDDLLKELHTETSPEVIHINRPDLTEGELKSLTEQADCAVYPSRAEGFGLPIAEAMLVETPVITTNYSGQLDFVNEDNAYLIDYELEYAKDSEMVNIGAMWAEPNIEDLTIKMKMVFDETPKNLKTKIQKAKERAQELTWERAAEEIMPIVQNVGQSGHTKQNNIAVICPRHSQDGISQYNERLYDVMEGSFEYVYYLANKDIADRTQADEHNVIRTWETGETSFEETVSFIAEKNIDIVHIQYHSGSYFPIEGLDQLIQKLHDTHIIVELHAVRGPGFNLIESSKHLQDANVVIIHNKKDFEYAKQSLSNVTLLPLAEREFPQRSKAKVKKQLGLDSYDYIISTHGLLNKNKQVDVVIDAFADFLQTHPNSLFLGLTAVSPNNIHSGAEFKQINELVHKRGISDNVVFLTDFLDREELEIYLQAVDIIVLAYADAGESASAAVRTCIASSNPVITSSISQFDEFHKEVIKVEQVSSKSLADALEKVTSDESLMQETKIHANLFMKEHSFEKKGVEILMLT